MDEDISVKAPVTRLRRRMSVEGEDSPLPTTPSTPTKKRATRLAAKPQLELIDEVASENVPKRSTRKAAVKENIEADTNTGTPTPVTPSRRSTRIRSNTSILSETTTQNIESPRAKRALRRNSQLGSDTESSALTPARSTRRTRKDSTTNVDKQAGDESVVVSSTNAEDTEKEPKDSKINETDDHSSTRKSPRLQNKKGGKTENPDKEVNNSLNKSINNNKSPQEATPVKSNHVEVNGIDDATSNESEKERLLQTYVDAINEMKTNVKKSDLNKSTSAIEKIANDLKNKRKRTKSWTTLSSPSNIVNNEEIKTDVKGNAPNISITGSGDGLPTSDENQNTSKIKVESNINSPNKSMNAKKSISNEKSVDSRETLDYENNKSDTAKLFEKSPYNQEPLIVIDDSDSGSMKLSMDIQMDGEDQCVPVVVNATNESPKKSEQTVEPMDIDESMPVNVTIEDFSDKSNTSKEDLEVPDKRKSSVSEKNMAKDESINKSKRKSSIRSETANGEENTNDIINKSDKNSSIPSKINSSTSDQEIKNKSWKEKANMSQVALNIDENESRETSNKSLRKSSLTVENNELDESSNKSKRKSSISMNNSVNINESTKSQGNTSISVGSQFQVDEQNDEQKLNESSNESKRKSSVSLNHSPKKSIDKSQRKSSMSIEEDNVGKLNESLKNSKRKSSNSLNNTAVNQNESKEALDSSKRKSSISMAEDNAEKLDGSSNKSKRKSSISLNNSAVNQKSTINESNDSSNKPNKNSSVSQSDLLNENKSTLVISQLKDVSTNDTNNTMSPNVTNNELSKSMNGPEVKNKGIDKKNTSLNYLTSTPILQKPLQKLAIQINTSIISPGVENKNNTSEKAAKKNSPKQSVFSEETDEEIKFKNTKENSIAKNSVTPKKKNAKAPSSSESSDEESDTETKTPIKKILKKSPNKKPLDNSSSDSDDESDSESRKRAIKTPNKKQNQSMSNSMRGNKTKTPSNKPPSDSSDTSEESEQEAPKYRKMVDDEASDAGEDYESGDSQNEEDKRYEADNEIVEKGETLDSDEEFSNDSDYEKDSFIVSSDAEDNEILSGTGDDLSLTDNELTTMSAKSKNKFNERKLKQQKKASREMYEARHKIDESASSTKSETKSKKSKRQRLESSNLESENENSQPKKNNRRRIDSSQDSILDKSDADESIGIKKKKSKRLSESVHDITTNEKEITINQSTTEKNDPLSVAIKQEPKTPLRKFDISTIAINDNIEEVQVDANESIMKQNESLDPLQATMIADDYDDSSSSDNMEFIQNYDSVLNNLSMQTKKIKTADTSLNLNKKSKDSKNPVIDQLNLTQDKQLKKNKAVIEKKPASVPQTTKSSKTKNDEDSSDSIDMKLLFPEDSNDSEINASQFKSKTAEEPEEDIIPLKRTEALTNIPKNMDKSESELNVSKTKTNKRKSSISVPEEVLVPNDAEGSEDSNIKIFIDTIGTHQVESETSIIQTNSSKKKKNKKNKSLIESTAIEKAAEIDCTDGTTETPVEISFTSEKKKKKNKDFDVSINKIVTSFAITEIQIEKKRKNSGSTSFAETQSENTVPEGIKAETSMNSENKKKNKKKNKENLDNSQTNVDNAEPEKVPAETSMNSEKKKKKKNKKKNKQNPDNSQTNVDNAGEESDDAPMEISYKSEKKSDAAETVTEEAIPTTEKKKHKKNKKKKNKSLSQSMEKSENTSNVEQEVGDESTKRKRKASGNSITEVEAITVTTSNEKKKRKIHLDDECLAAYDDTEQNNEDGSSKKSKKKKNKNLENIIQDELPKDTKKRKNRDDDNDEKINKVSKQNSFDKIHVPKIPESVIKQLLENPGNNVSEKMQNNVPKDKKKKTNAVIATVPFVVEEAERRKNKPSNYLEQSVYLNDSPVKTKQKRFKDKPKVLPFTPTALTSDSGYTSKFNINVLPGQTQFVAQASNVDNFRESFLGNQRIKKMGTLERFKLHRSHKISKF